VLRAETQALFRVQGRHAAPAHHDAVMMMEQGNAASYWLRRLARDRLDILAVRR
jgi:hypothetical protein